MNDASGIFARARRPGVYLRELGTAPFGLLLLVLIAVAPQFFSAGNLRDLAVANAPVLIIAIGMTLVLLTGHVDISVGSHFAVCSVAAALLARTGLRCPWCSPRSSWCALLGAINGLFVARLGLPSVVVTLATMVIWRDSLRWVRRGVQDLPAGFQWFGLPQRTGEWAIVLAALGVLLAARRPAVAGGRARGLCGRIRPRSRTPGGPAPRSGGARGLHGARHMHGVGRRAELDPVLSAGQRRRRPGDQGARGRRRWRHADHRRTRHPRRHARRRGLLGVLGTALTFLGINPFWEKAAQGAIILLASAADALAGLAARRPARSA